MDTNETTALQAASLLDYYKASQDVRAHQAKLDGLIARRRLVEERGRDGEPPVTKDEMPSRAEVAAATMELDASKGRAAGVQKRCRDHGVDIRAIALTADLT